MITYVVLILEAVTFKNKKATFIQTFTQYNLKQD